MSVSEKRIGEMEEILAHHEKTIEELSSQLAGQWQNITEMERKIYVLTNRLIAVEDTSLETPEITKPPHY